jgi:hypothetical protein
MASLILILDRESQDKPVYYGDGPPIGTISVGKYFVVHADVFEAFDDGKRRAGYY